MRAAVSALFLIAFLAAAKDAAACACCSAMGTRVEERVKLGKAERETLDDISFAPQAWLYSTEAGAAEGNRGLPGASEAAYAILRRGEGAAWRLEFTDEKGGKGALSFKLPARVERFEIDTHLGEDEAAVWDRRAAERRDTRLYKEWRIVAPVTGDGFFAKPLAKPARLRLVLHGQGNACPSSADFSRWSLSVTGPDAKFSFFGRLETARPR